MTDLNDLVFYISFRKYCANLLSYPSPSPAQKNPKKQKETYGTSYQLDHHIIFEKFEYLKHSQYWRKPCITIVICLFTESNL